MASSIWRSDLPVITWFLKELRIHVTTIGQLLLHWIISKECSYGSSSILFGNWYYEKTWYLLSHYCFFDSFSKSLTQNGIFIALLQLWLILLDFLCLDYFFSSNPFFDENGIETFFVGSLRSNFHYKRRFIIKKEYITLNIRGELKLLIYRSIFILNNNFFHMKVSL